MLDIRQLTYEFRSRVPLRLNMDLPTSTLRGALGYAMADVLAYEHTLPVERDKIELFRRYFAPTDWDASGHRKDGPRPFVLRGGFSDSSSRRFVVEMLLFGQAAQLEALTDLVIERMATRGIGGGQHYGTPCSVRKLESRRIEARFPPDVGRIAITFLSPTRIKSRKQWCQHSIPFVPLIARLADRYRDLIHAFGEPDNRDWQAWALTMKRAAGSIESLLLEGGRMHARRRSTRTGDLCGLDGFVGKMLYQGDFEPFSEILAYLPFIHVGKSAPFGCGWCVCECYSLVPA